MGENKMHTSANISRSRYLDVLKGIAIVLVVLGHNIQYGSGASFFQTDAYYDNHVFKVIYSFHMPLFAIVSGLLFFYSAEKRSTAACIKNRFLGLCVPVLAWTLCVEFAKIAVKIVVLRESFEWAWILIVLKACVTEHWFIWAVFWCSMIVILNRKLFSDSIIVYLVIFVLLPLCPDKGPLHLYAYLYPYFVGAYVLQKYALPSKIRALKDRWKIIAGILAMILWCLMLWWFNADCYIYTTHISIWGKNLLQQLGVDVYRWIIGVLGCIVVMVSAFYLNRLQNFAVWVLSNLGKHTLGIYIISSYLNVYLLLKITKDTGLHYWLILVETVLMLLVTVGITWGISKIKILNRVFLGRR